MTVHKPNTTKYQKSIASNGPKLWNRLPKEIQEAEDPGLFKVNVRKHLEKHLEKQMEEKEKERERGNRNKESKPKKGPGSKSRSKTK